MSKSSDVQISVERMKRYMELRGLRPNTVNTFTRCARRFLTHAGKLPSAIATADVEDFLLDLARRGRSPRTRNVNLAGIRCLLLATLGPASRAITAAIPNAKHPHRCLEILSGSEVGRLLEATDSPKYRAIFMLAYGAGLRVSEITALRACDIDSERMLIHVPEGKTGPRHVMLSPRVLAALRADWKAARPKGPELFPGGRVQRPGTRLAEASTRYSPRWDARPASRSAFIRMGYATPSPRTCRRPAPTSAACRCCSVMLASKPPPRICT